MNKKRQLKDIININETGNYYIFPAYALDTEEKVQARIDYYEKRKKIDEKKNNLAAVERANLMIYLLKNGRFLRKKTACQEYYLENGYNYRPTENTPKITENIDLSTKRAPLTMDSVKSLINTYSKIVHDIHYLLSFENESKVFRECVAKELFLRPIVLKVCKQMATSLGDNVSAIHIESDFERLVKGAISLDVDIAELIWFAGTAEKIYKKYQGPIMVK